MILKFPDKCLGFTLELDNEFTKSAWGNFGKMIYQFQPETKAIIRKLERILIKLYRQEMSLLFNQTCLYSRSENPEFIPFFRRAVSKMLIASSMN